MIELVERYVHRVGHYLPEKERDEIEAELRSLIQDQLDDRFEGSPSQSDVASVLADLGDPRKMAASYSSEQYLVGPNLYPYMMMALRYGLPRVPAIVVFVNVVRALASSPEGTLLGLFLETMFAAVLVTFMFLGVVVLIFAMMQHSDVDLDEKKKKEAFNPLHLPEINHPGSIDRAEVGVGMAFAVFFGLTMIYFWRVGGLTLRFNLNDPGEVVAAPNFWMIALIIVIAGQIVLNFVGLRRDGWNVGLLLGLTALELFSVLCLYFVVFDPLAEHFVTPTSWLNDVPLITLMPELIAVILIIVGLNDEGRKLFRLWNHTNHHTVPVTVQTDG